MSGRIARIRLRVASKSIKSASHHRTGVGGAPGLISTLIELHDRCALAAGYRETAVSGASFHVTPGGYDRVLKRVGIQYCRISSTTAGMSL